ncbi:MAG: hypothetical protein AVDCRST_MAG70-2505, partial [uncultured Thermomicrobiales bacterium]
CWGVGRWLSSQVGNAHSARRAASCLPRILKTGAAGRLPVVPGGGRTPPMRSSPPATPLHGQRTMTS